MQLIKPPQLKKGHRNITLYTVTGGKQYTGEQLEKITGIDTRTVKLRIKRSGWKDPDILKKSTNGYNVLHLNSSSILETLRQSGTICPIMQGSTNLRITRNGFRKACEFHQNRVAANNSKYHSNRYCSLCKGEHVPKGVKFITKKELEEFRRSRQ